MKATINRKIYDTATAQELASASGGGYCNDFHHWEETLYRTKKGAYFLHGTGGPCSRYAESCGDGMSGGSRLVPLSESVALAWCEAHECQAAINEHFNHLTEEA